MLNKLKALQQNDSFMRYFRNSSWMMAEYALKIISAIFVSIYVARYLGPEQFGLLSYALAIVAIFMAISRLGMDSILVRDLTKCPEKSKAYMGTAFGLMLIAAIVGFSLLSIIIYFLEADAQTRLYVWVIASGLLFQTFLVIDYAFQAQVKAKYSSIAKSIALAISSSVKIYLVWIQADLFSFAVAYAFDHFIIAMMLLSMHLVKKQENFLFELHKELIKPMLISAWPIIAAAGLGVLLLKLDKIFIKFYLGSFDLGVYVAAIRLYEGWIMIPQVIALSLLPAIVKLKQSSQETYERRMSLFFRYILIMNVILALIVTVFANEIILLLYGDSYIDSANVLKIVIWCSVLMGIGSISFRYLVVENLEKKILIIMALTLSSNVLFNIVLIPLYGVTGAAMALLASLFIGYFMYDWFDSDLRVLRMIKLRSLYVQKINR